MVLVVGDWGVKGVGIAGRVEVKRGDIERSPPESKFDWHGVRSPSEARV